ncbi:MFS transporter [Alicyclobacillus suci]|uniref:MFS transporter n=1 Tax=Alicyclobacillus suci TaxID=2816080 RepID=UPI002E2DC776|nr:MFS transporter [Alicyclobacillus suci]
MLLPSEDVVLDKLILAVRGAPFQLFTPVHEDTIVEIRVQFLSGLIIFCVSTVLSATSVNWTEFLIAQSLQAFADALVVPVQATLIKQLFPSDKIGWAFGWQGAVLAFASFIGPPLGGVIIQYFSWRYLFVLMLLFGLISLGVAIKFIPKRDRNSSVKLEWREVPMMNSICLIAFFLGVQALLLVGPKLEWIFLTGVGLVCLLVMEHFSPNQRRFFPKNMLTNSVFVFAALRGFFFFISANAIAFFVPSYFRSYFLYTPSIVGIILLVEPIVMIVLGGWGGRRADKAPLVATGVGSALMIISTVGLIFKLPKFEFLLLVAMFIVSGIGGALVVPAQNKIAIDNIDESQTGMYMGIFQMIQFISGGFAGAIFGKILEPTESSIISNQGFHLLLILCCFGFLMSIFTLIPNVIFKRKAANAIRDVSTKA